MILITGASRGIGQYMYNYFTQKGEEVYGIYHTTKPDETGNLTCVDVADYAAVENWINGIA